MNVSFSARSTKRPQSEPLDPLDPANGSGITDKVLGASKHPFVGWMIAIAVLVLMQFGLIGPAAERARAELEKRLVEIRSEFVQSRSEMENRLTRIEEQVRTLQIKLDQRLVDVSLIIEPLRVQIQNMTDRINELKMELREHRIDSKDPVTPIPTGGTK